MPPRKRAVSAKASALAKSRASTRARKSGMLTDFSLFGKSKRKAR